MYTVIHILGASGSGTTTLGRAIADRWGVAHLDTDDYFWLPTDPPYTAKRDIADRIALIRADIHRHGKCVLTGSLCGWGDELIPEFSLVVFVVTPTDVRVARLRDRERAKFGERILPGGDMHGEHEKFIAWAASYDGGGLEMRSRIRHEQWLEGLPCPIVRVDGAAPAEENLQLIAANMDQSDTGNCCSSPRSSGLDHQG